jgi:hypothetical protein
MSKHTIIAVHAVKFTPAGCSEIEEANVAMEIRFSFTPGRPATGPSYASGGDPADPAEVEIDSVELRDGDGIEPYDQKQLEEWAQDWLDDEGYDLCCAAAAEDRAADRERAAEMRAEDRP